MMGWYFNPHSGGDRIAPDIQEKIRARILIHARKVNPDKADRVCVRFRGQFCYIDEQEEPCGDLMPLCRLRYFRMRDRFSLDFYTYSDERYKPCIFGSGEWFGTPEEALEIGMMYLA